MKILRIILAILLIIPLGLLFDALILRPLLPYSNAPREYIYLIVGVPILVVNVWLWFAPDVFKSKEGK